MFWTNFRRTDPHTSVEAGMSVNTTELEEVVLNAIRSFGVRGCISDDICGVLPHLAYNSITPRFKRLIDKNLVKTTGEVRKAKSGRHQRVMVAV